MPSNTLAHVTIKKDGLEVSPRQAASKRTLSCCVQPERSEALF
jgi:hypothetical protein